MKNDRESEFLKLLESNKSKSLNLKAFTKIFKKLNVPEKTATEIFYKIDADKSDYIDKDEIKSYFNQQEIKLKALFESIDSDNSGKISIDELKFALSNLKIDIDHESSLDRIMKIYDKNNDGMIDFEEWKDILIFIPDVNLNYAINWSLQTTATLSFMVDTIPMQLYAECISSDDSYLMKFLKSFFLGGFSAGIARTLTAPLERLRILHQIGMTKNSIFHDMKAIVSKEGIRGLFRGNLVNVLKAAPDSSIKIFAFELLSKFLNRDNSKEITIEKIFIAGSLSGVISNFCVYPLEVLKTKLICSKTGVYNRISDTIGKIYKNEGGLKAFYKGYSAALLCVLPNSGLSIIVDNFILKSVFKILKTQEIPFCAVVGIGALSAGIVTTFLYPFNLLSANLIMQGSFRKIKNKNIKANELHAIHAEFSEIFDNFDLIKDKFSKNTNLRTIAKEIYIKDGILGYFKGFKAAASKLIIGNAVSCGAYHILKDVISK